MAHSVEPMDIDCIDSDFDNKENTFHHNNVQPCTEKGYEELDVSELNMKLRYSVTPAASPMSKSFTNCIDNRTLDYDDSLNSSCNDVNLTRSLNSSMTKNDSVVKSLKSLPLQSLPTDQPVERSVSVLRQLDSTITAENNNITVTVSGTNDIEENLSLPSSSSSHTPEATTPTKDIPKNDGGSPIMRGLKSVLNMFRSSQSPIPPPENESTTPKQLTPTSTKRLSSEPRDKVDSKTVLASTPIAAHRDRDANGSKRNSPYKDSIIFNDDLEKELQWKDETTILFSEEKIPIHKLFYPQKKNKVDNKTCEGNTDVKANLDTTVEYMDISCNDSVINDKTMTEVSPGINNNELHVANESDSEFLDCETESNVTKTASYMLEKQVEELSNENISKQDIVEEVTISADNQEIIQQIDNIVKNTLNVSSPIEGNNLLANGKNLCTSLSQNISKIQAPCDNVTICEEIQNTTQVLEKAPQEPSSEIMSQTYSHDGTMTLDYEEVKDKTVNNVLEVSTLESHTQSLSSLIESLDNTKTTEKEDNTACNYNDLKIDTPEETIQVPLKEPESSNVTITINNQESDKFEATPQQCLNIPDSMHSTFQNPNITIDIVNQKDIIGEDKVDTSKNNVLDNIMNITQEINKDDALTQTAIQEPKINTYKESTVVDQVPSSVTNVPEIVQLIESPADIPLPDDEAIEENLITPPDVSTVMTDNVPLPLVDKSVTEIEVNNIIENAVGVIAELNRSGIPELAEDTKELNLENQIRSPLQGAIIPDKEENTDIRVPKVSNNLESKVKNTGEINNVENAVHAQTYEIDENMINVSAVPNVINQSVLEDVDMMVVEAPVGHALGDNTNESTSNKISNLFENGENNISSTGNNQEEHIPNHNQNNITSILLPENQITSSILACEEILDKNREISEVILTEQKIDKLQHECDVVSSFAESKDEALQMSMKENQQNSLPGDLNARFEKIESDVDQVKVNQITDVNKSLIETESQNNGLKSVNIIEDIKCSIDDVKYNADQENAPIENVNAIKNDKVDNKNINDSMQQEEIQTEVDQVKTNEINTANKTMTMENDVKVKHDAYRDKELQEEKIKDIDQNIPTVIEKSPEKLITVDGLLEKNDLIKADDEIIISENNSPYVSIAADLDKVSDEKPLESFEEIENPFTTNTKIPSSPPIASKGYNFNFDDIDDPFATKVKIRMSPTPDTPSKPIELKKDDKKLQRAETFKKDTNKNRRKSQPARPKLSSTKKPFNATFDCSPSENNDHQSKTDYNNEKLITDANVEEQINMSIDMVCNTAMTIDVNKKDQELTTERSPVDNIDTDVNKNTTLVEEKSINNKMEEENKHSTESIPADSNEIKTTSSSEQSTYYSAGTSSSESNNTRNVFNLPEIDDMNFNPFATKAKIRQSPPRDVGLDNPFETKNKVLNSPECSVIMPQGGEHQNINNATTSEKNLEDKMETEPMEKDSSGNISNITSSSAGKDATIREVNTEDEDTIEGPFLEAEEIEEYKKSQFDGEGTDMMQFNELPAQEHEENADGELFIDAEAFEFLLNQNKSNVVADSGKESLFLKFDPLFAKRMSSDSVVAALTRAQKRQSTPTRTPRQQRNSPMSVAGPSTMNLNFEADLNATEDLNTTVTKPMMVVTPAVNPTAAIRKSITPTRTNRRSITFTSPAMAVIDRLLSLSANNSLVEQESTIPQVSREQNEAELALTQLREVLAEKEIHVYNLRSESKELKDRLSALETQMKVLEAEGQQRLKKINDLNDKLAEKTKMNKSMAVVVEEYERTIASLIAETEQDKKRHAEERIALMNERDEQTAHLASMEVSFNDLHSKYEKSKQVIMNYKANEETYKQSLKEFEENVTKMQKNYELLKQHATSKLNHANEELQKINRAHEAEVLKLNAMIKRKELHITSLEETLAQKTKANEELTAICDELINKVG